MKSPVRLLLCALFFFLWALGIQIPKLALAESQEDRFQRINQTYQTKIKPIFANKCLDCHSNQTRYPKYYKWPVVGWLIDRDVKNGREDLDMSDGFPFKSKKDPAGALQSIRKEIDEGDMPPLMYRWMHKGSAIIAAEKQVVFQWIDDSETLLK